MTHLPPKSTGGVKIIAISVIFTIFSILAVGLRIVAASIRRRSFRLHDYLSFAALVWMSRCIVAVCTERHPDLYCGFWRKRNHR